MDCHLDEILPVRYITCTQLTLFVGPAIQQTDRHTDRQTDQQNHGVGARLFLRV